MKDSELRSRIASDLGIADISNRTTPELLIQHQRYILNKEGLDLNPFGHFFQKHYDNDHTVYVSKGGDDTTGDGKSWGTAYKTFEKAITSLKPALTQTFNASYRGFCIEGGPGDFTENALLWNKGANLEIRGTGGRAAGGVGVLGGTNILTPLGGVGLTLGYRDDTDSSWLNSKGGCILRNLHVRPVTTDTGSSTGIKIIGLSNCSFYDVSVAEYAGTGSVGWHVQSSVIANGGSTGATMYNNWYSCSATGCLTGWKVEGATVSLWGCLIDGMNDLISNYLAGSVGVILTNGSSLSAYRLFLQALETGIDDSQSHAAGTIYSLNIFHLRMESVKTGVISNQLGTNIIGGTYYSGGLSGGTSGTTAFDMRAGAEFTIQGLAVAGVATDITVASGATGTYETSSGGKKVYGKALRGKQGGVYVGSTPTAAIQGSAGTSATFDGFTAGSTDVQGEFKFTAGSASTSVGTMVRITFGDGAYASGVTPMYDFTIIGNTANSANRTVNPANYNSPTNTQIDVYMSDFAPTALQQYTVQYRLVGTLP